MLDINLTFGGALFMAKYSLETKLESVKNVIEHGMSFQAAAKLIGTEKSVVRTWVGLYKEFGEEGLTKKSGSYSGDFKVSVVKYMHDNHMSAHATAIKFGIRKHSTVCKWEQIYWDKGPEALYKDNRRRTKKMPKSKIKNYKLTKQVNQEEETLEQEVKRLRMENDYLKKLNALVQAREESAKKTK